MVSTIIAFIHRIEDILIGDVESALKPLTRIQARLEAVQKRADQAASDARADAEALMARAEAHGEKAAAAVSAATKLAGLLG